MSMYKYVRELWNKPKDTILDLTHQRLILWRKEQATVRVERPTRIDRARSLGYRAKQGILVVRQRVPRGGHRKPFPSGGRRTRKWTTRKSLMMNYRTIAEQRAARAYVNCEVLNSYEVGKDGRYYWYEVILVDVAHPAIKADPTLKWMTNPVNRGRVFRGLTSSAKKSRGLRRKGMGAEKIRPSRSANKARRYIKHKKAKYVYA
ncbi:MAG TPA: 50S ribosomal protein L15e [Candidatus Nanoarchaeia archaeon]|nr:50S ribosomal protein L15e [Candidatus Nanoarchaeia archaeon]